MNFSEYIAPNEPSKNGSNGTTQSAAMEGIKDIKYYASLILSKWYWLVFGALVAAGVLFLHLRYAKKQYKIAGSVLVEDISQKEMSKEALAREFGFEEKDVNMEDRVRIIGSPELMYRVVDSLNLNISYVQEGKAVSSEFYNESPVKLLYWNTEGSESTFKIRIKHYDSLRFMVYRAENDTYLANYGIPFKYNNRELVLKKLGYLSSEQPVDITVSDKYATAEKFRSKMNIEQSGRSNVINMDIVDELPDRGIAILNRLSREYGRSIMETKNDAGQRTLRFIDDRLNYVTGELYSVEKNVENFKRDRDLPMEIPDIAKNYLDRSNLVDSKINSLNDQVGKVNSIEEILKKSEASKKYEILPYSSEIISNAPLADLMNRYNTLVNKNAELIASAQPANPAFITNDEQLKYLRNNILISIQAIKGEVNEQKQNYQQQLVPLEAQLNTMPTNQRELTQIMREQGIKQQLFLFLLQKREETAISVAAQVSSSRMLERATNRGIVSPKPLQLGLFYLFMGLLIPAFFFYVQDTFSNKVFQRTEIHKHLPNVPFVGFLPHTKSKKDKLVINDSRSVLAEAFRLVRSNLQHKGGSTNGQQNGQSNKIMLVTSSVSGEGKTFVAVNLAITMAMMGKKVALIGLDLRKPKLEKYLTGETSETGIADYLSGKMDLTHLLKVYDRTPNLHYADCGNLPTNPTELIMTDKMKILFEYAAKKYDYVIVDGAPIGLVADSFFLNEHIDQTLIVLRYNYSSIGDLKFMNEVNQTQKLPNMQVLLNDVRKEYRNHYNYGYYTSSYYSGNKSLKDKIQDIFKTKKRRKTVA